MQYRSSNFRCLAALALVATASIARAQASNASRAAVRVTAKDSSGAPIVGAEVTITQGLKDVVAHGSTDSLGQAVMSVQVKDSADFQATIRKIGYRRGDRFFEIGPFDTARVAITVPRPKPNVLDAVKVTAERDNKRFESYDLYADEIEDLNRPIDNAWDIVKDLRPSMLTSHGGCGTGVQNVWVNGKRIRLPLPPTGLLRARERVGVPPSARFSQAAVSILGSIAPEHVQEIHYKDCFDTSVAAVGANDAIFITLKPGVIYQQDVGSFVVDEATETERNAKK